MADLVLAAEYRPFDKQVAFHRSRKRFKVAAAGNRGGKTKAGGAEFVWNIWRDYKAGRGRPPAGIGSTRAPRLLYWCVSPTHELGQYPYEEVVRFIPPELRSSINQSTRTIWLHGDIKIEFKTAERPERLVGARVDGLWVDEACRVKAEAWRGSLRARLADAASADPNAGWALFTTSPLGGPNSWVFQELVNRHGVDEHVDAFHWTTADNPYIARAEVEHAKRTLPDAWFKRDWEANWQSFGGAIYPEFTDAHVTNEERFRLEHGIPPHRKTIDVFNRVIGAIDWGYVAPGCMLAVGELGDGKWVVFDESYGPGRRPIGTKENWLDEAKKFQQLYGIREFFADPEDAGAVFDLRNNGINIQLARKNVYTGIRRVAQAMHEGLSQGRPGLRVFDRCRNLIRELRDYVWKSNRDQSGFFEEPAENQSDHAADCLRYAAMELNLYSYVEKSRQVPAGGGSFRY